MIPVQLEYTAQPGCPTQAQLVASVSSRGGDFDHPGAGMKARTMVVTVQRSATQYVGTLELRGDDTATDARELRADTCAAVVDGLAVVAAIALRGAEEPQSSSSAPASAAPLPPAPPEGQSSLSAEPAPPKPAQTRLRPIGLWGNEAVPVSAGELQVRRELAFTLSGGALFGAVPGLVLPRYDLSLMRTNFITTPEGSNLLIGNVFGVRWGYLGNATRKTGQYTTDINGFQAGVTACSSLTYDTNGFVALLCSSFLVGLMHLETKDALSDYRQRKNVGLGAATFGLNARYTFGKYLHVGLALDGGFWVSKLSAERADGAELFHSRLFNGSAQLGIGVHF